MEEGGYRWEFVLDTALIQQIMRWDMVVLEQSPWAQEFIERGRTAELRRQVLRAVEHRFGEIPSDLPALIEGLSSEQLDPLLTAAWTDASLDAFLARLPK
jgi:Domain of unknown function (DUF4351)